MEKTVNITNFIGTYDNYISDADCDKAIKLFEEQNKFNNTLNRVAFEQAPVTQKQDQQFFASPNNIDVWWEQLKPMMVNFDQALKHYQQHSGIDTCYPELFYTNLKIQKTLPTEGYHVWHIEHGKGYQDEARALVFSIYLNDVEEAGETEFLHFSKRVKPKKGRIVIFPSGFPYLHRGNPPISNEKYILTSWLMCR
jgi:hypothetical protein|tara:strand:- start:91 stop:678 length:588 start_codon:yes stop_codon:yes gene_type:complete